MKISNILGRIAFFAVILLAILFCLNDFCSYDAWLHLRTGKVIAKTLSIPNQEIYSHTAFGKNWIDHSWLFQLFIFLLYKMAGLSTLLVLRTILAIGLISILFLTNSRLSSRGLRLLFTLAAILMIHGRLPIRPEVFSLVFDG